MERNIALVLNNPGLLPSQRKVISEFLRELAVNGLAHTTQYDYAYNLKRLAIFVKKPFKSVTKNDLMRYFESYTCASDTPKKEIKRFFKWLYGGKTFPPVVEWIKFNGSSKRKLPEEMLTKDDIKRMVVAAQSPRDKAVIMVLYDSGCRAGELINLKLKHVTFDKYGATLIMSGKTGMRRVRLIDAVPYLKAWINRHPHADDPDAALFAEARSGRKAFGNNATLANALKRAVKRAGLKKRIYPHLFRHSRATELAKTLSEQEMKVFFGWSGTSKTAGIYTHLSGEDVDKKLLEARGLLDKTDQKKKTEEDNALKPKTCPSCNTVNPATAKFCMRCSAVLELQTAIGIDSVLNELMRRPTFKKNMAKELIEMGQAEQFKQIVES